MPKPKRIFPAPPSPMVSPFHPQPEKTAAEPAKKSAPKKQVADPDPETPAGSETLS